MEIDSWHRTCIRRRCWLSEQINPSLAENPTFSSPWTNSKKVCSRHIFSKWSDTSDTKVRARFARRTVARVPVFEIRNLVYLDGQSCAMSWDFPASAALLFGLSDDTGWGFGFSAHDWVALSWLAMATSPLRSARLGNAPIYKHFILWIKEWGACSPWTVCDPFLYLWSEWMPLLLWCEKSVAPNCNFPCWSTIEVQPNTFLQHWAHEFKHRITNCLCRFA